MSAPKRISDPAVVEALQRWAGNVTAAAEELGLARNNLYQRIYALGLDLEPVRIKHNGTEQVSTGNASHRPARPVAGVQRSSTAIFPRPAKTPNLAPMETAVAIQTRRTKPGPIRLRPDQVEALREAKFDFQAKHRTEVGESDLLQRFFDEGFAEWLKRCLEKKVANR